MLHLLCGKIASGKSTLAKRLAGEEGAILLSEDELMAQLYPGEILTPKDFRERTARLEAAIAPIVTQLLANSLPVVLDFHANTRERRQWMAGLAEQAGVRARLHWLDVSDETCKARLRERNASGEHPFETSEEMFDQFTAHFTPPLEGEGFDVQQYGEG
ncbi:ATP-binding protein [Parvularcula sp. ZS-1/3]|uniref:ATP-binding protein n=1 Tax=Parvularcula mediterranea TaxID=2732508 RepID=A0A7Y3RJ91_9PROT|nr:ATP-binding protein [Parvularcula mediterranea]NNU15077.1 ATP-binding protein [Parvularcula mediterranea]